MSDTKRDIGKRAESDLNFNDRREYKIGSARVVRKGEILKNVVDVVKMYLKSVIKRFRRLQTKEKSCLDIRGRPVVFTKDTDAAETVWKVANEPCGELLFPITQKGT